MTDTIKIRSLNYRFRQLLVFGGVVLFTPGVTSLPIDPKPVAGTGTM